MAKEIILHIDETECIIRSKNGDTRAFGLLYSKYSGSFFGIAHRFAGGDIHLANDLLQESFIRIFQKLHLFNNDGSFAGWAKRIVVTTSINYLKKEKKIYFENIEEAIPLQNIDDNFDIISYKIDAVKIQQYMNTLKTGYRTVLNLHIMEGYTYKEIAKILEISEVTVRTQYMRAKDKLIDVLKKNRILENEKASI